MELSASAARRFSRPLSAFLPLLALLGAAPLLASCSGHGDGGTGDLPSEPGANAYGDGKRVDDVVKEADWYDPSNKSSLDCGSPEPKKTRLTGLTVVAVDDFDENNDGRIGNVYAVQTPGKKGLQPYDGITLRTPSYTPPDLRLFPGQVVDASGNFVEFLGPPAFLFGYCETLPQIEGTVTYRFDGSDVAAYPLVPTAEVAAAAGTADRWAVLKSYEAARPFIGMLVRLDEVKIGEKRINDAGDITIPIDVDGGVALADVPAITNELYDIAGTGPAMPDNATFVSVTGIVTYFYGFKVAPRGPSDIVAQTAPPATSASSGGASE